jgi:hypothetical protein
VKKWERALRQILYLFYERNVRFMNQKAIAEVCGISLGTVNPLVKKLDGLGAVQRKPLGFRVSDVGRVLLYWANTRDLERDVVLRINTDLPVEKIEGDLPPGSLLTGYSAFRARFGGAPGGYREIHVYAAPPGIKRRFSQEPRGENSIVVLKPDEHLSKVSGEGIVPIGQMYVDLWQLGTPAKAFVDYLNSKMRLIEIGTLKGIIRRTREKA